MPLIFLENIGDQPFGKKEDYLLENKAKDRDLNDFYEEMMLYVTANKEILASQNFIYQHMSFLTKKK